MRISDWSSDVCSSDLVDSLISYIRKNSRLLSRRPVDSPLIVLVDWEVSDSKLANLKQAYGADADRYIVRANPAHCSAELGSTFVGLEQSGRASCRERVCQNV